MKRSLRIVAVLAGAAAMSFVCRLERTEAQLPAGPAAGVSGVAAKSGIQILTRGPIHEAFAAPVLLEPVKNPIIPVAPPPALREIPPAYAPKLANVSWAPGYWGWDADRKDHLWVSGGWRVSPPSQRYIPGYWSQVSGGYQWSPGFWTGANTTQLRYLPPLPDVDAGQHGIAPLGQAPSPNHFWIPGSYAYQNGNYNWHQGRWGQGRENFVWVPDRYMQTANGAIFAPGYWDYPMNGRGQLFAPAYIPGDVAAQPGFQFSPDVALQSDQLLTQAFVPPGGASYCFGDYYGDDYASAGWIPWYQYGMNMANTYGYDPMFSYYQWYYGRRGVNYGERMGGWHNYYLRHADLRPPTTFAGNAGVGAPATALVTGQVAMLGVPLAAQVAQTAGAFALLNMNQRNTFAASALQLQSIAAQRASIEGVPGGSAGAGALAGQATQVPTQLLRLPAIPAVQVPGVAAPVAGVPRVGVPGVGVPAVGVPNVPLPDLGVPGLLPGATGRGPDDEDPDGS